MCVGLFVFVFVRSPKSQYRSSIGRPPVLELSKKLTGELKHPLVVHEAARFILKESHWFNMKASSDQKLIPQTEEQIQEIKWVKPEDIEKYFDNAFPSVVEVLRYITVDK